MKPLVIGLTAAFALAAVIGVSTTVAQKDASMDAVAPLIAAAKLPCTVTAAKTGPEVNLGDKPAKTYEIACSNGVGYVLINRDKAAGAPIPPQTCAQMALPDANGKPQTLACKLPANAKALAQVQTMVDQTGRSCKVDKYRLIGYSTTLTFLEVSCAEHTGYLVKWPISTDVAKAGADNCLAYSAPESKIKCTLSTTAGQMSVVDTLAAATGKCTLKDKRFVASDVNGNDYFEAACADGNGYILKADSSGKLADIISCAVAAGDIACTLTDSRAAMTQQSAVYTSLAQKAGFDCQVSRYWIFQSKNDGNEAVELQCSNRPDGGVGVFPVRGPGGHVFDCLHSPSQGYRCTHSDDSPHFAALTANLKALNRNTCTVSGARFYASTTEGSDLIEVACSDGNPGWVVDYPKGSDKADKVYTCTQAAGIGGGGCQLPTNTKH